MLAEDGELIADLAHPGARVVLARGGHGGRGNARFVSSTRQVPRFAEVGPPGDELDIELHLKLLADAALVGLPNAGKSSLLSRISNARPKVADYPFTTLQPVLGTVEAPDGRQLVVADIPGLIEGASEGVGLGHEFLAHLERARTLVHVLDSSLPLLRAVADDRRRALPRTAPGSTSWPQIVVLNKIDLVPEPPRLPGRGRAGGRRAGRSRVRPARASTSSGADSSRSCPSPCRRRPGSEPDLLEFLVYRPEPKARPWRLFRTDRGLPARRHAAAAGRARARAARRRRAKVGAHVEIADELGFG